MKISSLITSLDRIHSHPAVPNMIGKVGLRAKENSELPDSKYRIVYFNTHKYRLWQQQ